MSRTVCEHNNLIEDGCPECGDRIEPSDFGKRLTDARKKTGLTLQAVAEKIGSSKSYVWEMENKPFCRPTVDKAQSLAAALGTTIYALIGEPEPDELSAQTRVMLRRYLALSESGKKTVRELIDVIKLNDNLGPPND